MWGPNPAIRPGMHPRGSNYMMTQPRPMGGFTGMPPHALHPGPMRMGSMGPRPHQMYRPRYSANNGQPVSGYEQKVKTCSGVHGWLVCCSSSSSGSGSSSSDSDSSGSGKDSGGSKSGGIILSCWYIVPSSALIHKKAGSIFTA